MGPFPGYAHLDLNGTQHAVVYAIYDNVKFPNKPPETAGDIPYNEPFEKPVLTRIGNHDAGCIGKDEPVKSAPLVLSRICEPGVGGLRISVGGDGESLAVRQAHATQFQEVNGVQQVVRWNNTIHQFYGLDVPAVVTSPPGAGGEEVRRPSFAAQDELMVVVSIDGENYAAVSTIGGPPAFVDAAGAAALGMGDIRHITPADYMRWNAPADAPPTEGTIMKVSGLGSDHGDWDKTYFAFTVRNVYHEPLEIYIDRAAAGSSFFNPDFVVEQSHPYSDFDSGGYGEIRLSGRFLGGYFGPSAAYPAADIPYKKPLGFGNYDTGVHRHVYTVYSNEELKRVFAYARAPDVIRLEPGQSSTTGITLYSPCLYREDSTIWTDGACGIGGVSLNKYALDFDHANLVLVADGHPEWAVVAYLDQECTRTAGMTVHCAKWETTEYESRVVHIDDVCEGAKCDSRP